MSVPISLPRGPRGPRVNANTPRGGSSARFNGERYGLSYTDYIMEEQRELEDQLHAVSYDNEELEHRLRSERAQKTELKHRLERAEAELGTPRPFQLSAAPAPVPEMTPRSRPRPKKPRSREMTPTKSRGGESFTVETAPRLPAPAWQSEADEQATGLGEGGAPPASPADSPWSRFPYSCAWLMHLCLLGLLCWYKYVIAPEADDADEAQHSFGLFVLSLWMAGLLLWVWASHAHECRDKVQASLAHQRARLRQLGDLWTTRELWTFNAGGDESEYTSATVHGLFGSDAAFLHAAASALVVVACQLALITLLLTFSTKGYKRFRINFNDESQDDFTLESGEQTKDAWHFDADADAARYNGSFGHEVLCYLSTGVVIIVFVFEDVINGLKLVSLNARVAFIKLAEEAVGGSGSPVRLMIKTRRLRQPDAVDEEEEGEPVTRDRHQLPSWPRTVVLVLLSWAQVAISLIITEYCVFNVQDNFRKNQMDELLLDFVGLSFISELDQLVRKARVDAGTGGFSIGRRRSSGERVYPQITAVWMQYTLPGGRESWRRVVQQQIVGASAHLQGGASWLARSRRSLLLALVSCCHALLMFRCSLYYRLGTGQACTQILGYLSGFLLFMVLFHSRAWHWLERRVWRGGRGLIALFFVLSVLFDLAEFAMAEEGRERLHLGCEGPHRGAWWCRLLTLARPYVLLDEDEAGSGRQPPLTLFMEDGLLHSFATSYFVAQTVCHTYADQVSESEADAERDARVNGRNDGSRAEQIIDGDERFADALAAHRWGGSARSPHRMRDSNGGLEEPSAAEGGSRRVDALFFLALAGCVAATAFLGSSALRELELPLLEDWEPPLEPRLWTLLGAILSSAGIVVAMLAAVSYLSHAYADANRREADRLSRPAARRREPHAPSTRPPWEKAIGLFVAHLYFRLPGGPVKRFLVECFQWSADVLKAFEWEEALGHYTLLALVGGMLAAAWLTVSGGWLLGKALWWGRGLWWGGSRHDANGEGDML